MAKSKKEDEEVTTPKVEIKSEAPKGKLPNEMVIKEIMIQKGVDRDKAIDILTK